MEKQLIDEVFAKQLEELNNETGMPEQNNWLSPAFIEAYEVRLNENIRKAKRWTTINGMVQILLIALIFLNERSFNSFIPLDRKYMIPLLLVLMIVFNFISGKQQSLVRNYDKQLLLIDTYKQLYKTA